jgi:hypothetical protein
MPGIQNITNLSSICGPSISPLPNSFMFIIQIFYGIICLLGELCAIPKIRQRHESLREEVFWGEKIHVVLGNET